MISDKTLSLVKKTCLELLTTFDEICRENDIVYWLDGGTALGAYRHKGFIPWDDDVDICVFAEDFQKVKQLLKKYCQTHKDCVLFFEDNRPFDVPYDFFGNIKYFSNGIFPIRIDIIPIKVVENNQKAIEFDESLTSIACLYSFGYYLKNKTILEEHKKFLPNGKNNELQAEIFFEYYSQYMIENKYKDCLNQNYLATYSYNDVFVKRDRDYFKLDDMYPVNDMLFENKKFKVPGNIVAFLTIMYGENFMEPPPIDQQVAPHVTKLKENKLPQQEVQFVLQKFYYYGFLNFALGKSKWQKKWIKGFNVVSFLMKLCFNFKIKSMRNLISYMTYKVKR